MKELTLEEAMKLHKELYLTMSKLEDYNKFLGRDLYTLKKHCLELMGFVGNECPSSYCFLCEYGYQQCFKCKSNIGTCFYCPLPSQCESWDPYFYLNCIFDSNFRHPVLTNEDVGKIRNACIEIRELKCEMSK